MPTFGFVAPSGVVTSGSFIIASNVVITRRPCIARRAVACTSTMALPELALTANPAAVDTVAKAFGTLNLPTWAVEWGHPAMMGLMVLGMGVPGAAFGWQGRLNEDKKKGVQQKKLHEIVMVAFGLLAFFGGVGGILSTAMQGYDILTTPHALSAGLVLAALATNGILAYSGFTIGTDGTPKGRIRGRTVHAYLGAATMTLFVLHAALGVVILLG